MAKKRKKTTGSTTGAAARRKKTAGRVGKRGAKQHTPGSLTRIEEAQMFTDRAVEAVGEQIDGLRKQVEQLMARVVLLEGHLRAYTDAAGPEPESALD